MEQGKALDGGRGGSLAQASQNRTKEIDLSEHRKF
jgi:hypothetical protein